MLFSKCGIIFQNVEISIWVQCQQGDVYQFGLQFR